MGFEVVRSSARDSNLIIPPILEPSGLFRNLVEEVEAFLLGASALLDHACEGVDFGGDVDHGGGEDGIEFAEVAYAAREVEGERVEGVGVFGEEGEGVHCVELGHQRRRRRRRCWGGCAGIHHYAGIGGWRELPVLKTSQASTGPGP